MSKKELKDAYNKGLEDALKNVVIACYKTDTKIPLKNLTHTTDQVIDLDNELTYVVYRESILKLKIK